MVKNPQFRSVVIYCHNKPQKEVEESIFIRDLIRFFYAKGVTKIHGDLRTVSLTQGVLSLVNDDQTYDLKIGIGGDGTLLKMIRTLQKNDGLLLGINFGTLGFLSELTPNNALSELEKVFAGDFHIDERDLIKSFVYRREENGKRKRIFRAYALNEVVFGHGGLARLTNYNVKINRRFLSTYRSDGVIFATPTGSTAYSMSAGGPIISPNVSTILITPVAPHTLTHRPILLPGDKVIHLDFEARATSIAMTIDGQIHFTLRVTDEVSLQQSTRKARFIRMKNSHYYRTLRKKLGWGNLTV
jgi:NAD+ kinase